MNREQTATITRGEAEALAAGVVSVEDVFESAGGCDVATEAGRSALTRRALMQGAGILGIGALLGAGGSAVSASAQGSLGQSGSPLAAAFLASIDGPIVDAGEEVTELVNIRVAEDDEEIEVDDDTLVIRYVEGGDG